MPPQPPDAELHAVAPAGARELVERHLLARAQGASTTDDELLAAHPGLREALAEELRRLRLIQRAQRAAESAAAHEAHPSSHGSLGIRCPHCYELFEFGEGAPLSAVDCPACGESFLLAGPGTRHGEVERKSIGPFLLLDKLGEGGFGTVWKARDTRLDRLVALKVPHASRMTRVDVELFLREARTAAQLRHPRIVAVHEVGRDGDLTYIVTDLVEGEPLSDRIQRERFSAREAASICAEIARALVHAHGQGVVHRDLKPANVLLDVEGRPKLTDFGLARRQADDVTLTVTGQVLGTPAYMSPEQAAGGAHQADARSDIYSLGVILFELLTGELPFRGSLRAMLDQVLQSEPPTPRRFNRSLPRDLETICLNCLEKQPSRRYASALALADDLERFLRGEPILARPVHRVERLWRWTRRNPVLSVLGLMVLGLAVVGPVVAVRQTRLAAREHAARNALTRSERDLRHNVYVARMNMVQQAATNEDYVRAEELLSTLVPRAGDVDLRGFEWRYWHGLCSRGLDQVIRTQRPIHAVAVSPDEKLLAFGGYEHRATLWDLAQRRALHKLDGHREAIKSLSFSSDGRLLATAGNDLDVMLWNTQTGALERRITRHTLAIRSVRFTPAGTLLSAAIDGQLLEHDPRSGDLVRSWPTTCRVLSAMEIAPDGTAVAVCGGEPLTSDPLGDTDGGDVVVWDYPSGRMRFREHRAEIDPAGLSFSPDARLVALAGRHGAPLVLDAETGQSAVECDPQANWLLATAFSRDGATVFAAGKLGGLWSWDIASGRVREKLPGHGSVCVGLTRAPVSGRLVTTGLDSSVRIWNLAGAPPTEQLDTGTRSLAIIQQSALGRQWLTSNACDQGATAQLWNVDQGVLTPARRIEAAALAMHPRDGSIVLSTESTSVDVDTGGRREQLLKTDEGFHVHWGQFSPDGNTLAIGCYASQASELPGELCQLQLWDWPTRTLRHRLPINRRRISELAFSPDSRRLASAGYDRALMIVDCQSGKVEQTFNLEREINQVLSCVAFSADGARLATGGNGRVWVWDARTYQLQSRLGSSSVALHSLAFAPDGRTLAVAQRGPADQGEVALWDTSTWEVKSTLSATSPIVRLAFDRAGHMLLGGDVRGQLLIWRAP